MALTIISRRAWGARHPASYRNRDAPLPARRVWLHHSATVAPDLVAPFDDDDAAVRTLERIGQQRFQWGISYSAVVTPSGRAYEGHRIDGLGAHTGGDNSGSRAICLIGDYEKNSPTPQQVDTLAELLVHGYRSGWWVTASLAGGHRDAPGASTACPGKRAHSLIPDINRRAAQLLVPKPAPTPAKPAARPTLQEGATGELVTSLKRWLNVMFPSYSDIPLTPDRYGPRMVAVVRQWQKNSDLADDGRFGPASWAEADRQGFSAWLARSPHRNGH